MNAAREAPALYPLDLEILGDLRDRLIQINEDPDHAGATVREIASWIGCRDHIARQSVDRLKAAGQILGSTRIAKGLPMEWRAACPD